MVTAILAALEGLGAVAVEADTDGVYFVPPQGHTPADDEILLERLTAGLPGGIQDEARRPIRGDVQLQDEDVRPARRARAPEPQRLGVSLRGLEPFQRQIIGEIVRCLIYGRLAPETRAIIDRWLADFAAHRVGQLRAFARTETLQESLEAYREKVRIGARSASASYELAGASGRSVQPGDQISYYVAGRGPNVAVNEYAKLAILWDAARPDNVEYYQVKVLEIWDRFRAFSEFDGLRPPAPDTETSVQLTLF